MVKKVYLQAGNSNVKQSTVELLREAAEKVVGLGDVALISFHLQPHYADEDNDYIDMEFYTLTKSDIELRKNAIELLLSEQYPTTSASPKETITRKNVGLLEVWNSMDQSKINKVSDIATLLNNAASELERLGTVEVLDIMMHDCVDDDALKRPYIRIYYIID